MTLQKAAEGLGLTLSRAKEIDCIMKDGIAERDGRLMVGDVLVGVNGISLHTYTDQEVEEFIERMELGSDVNIEIHRKNDYGKLNSYSFAHEADPVFR